MRQPDVEATIRFLAPDEGGRTRPVFQDFRTYFTHDGINYGAQFMWADVDRADPGDTVRALIRFFHPRLLVDLLLPGAAFQVKEADHVVASGEITRVVGLREAAQLDSD